MRQRPIDYDIVRRALVTAVRLATGLGQQSVIVAEPEQANVPHPDPPYMTIQFVEAATRHGRDYPVDESFDDTDITQVFAGPRSAVVSFNCFAETKEQASGIMELWQASLDSTDTLDYLRAFNIAKWKQGTVMDLTELWNAAYQPRAYMQVTFGLTSMLEQVNPLIRQVEVMGPGTDVLVPSDTTGGTGGGGGASTITVNCQGGDAVGNFVAMVSDNEVQSADCTQPNLVPAIGIIISKPTATTAVVQLNGTVPAGVLAGLDSARQYFLSIGGQAITAPVTACVYVQALGMAVTDQLMALNIAPTPVQRSL